MHSFLRRTGFMAIALLLSVSTARGQTAAPPTTATLTVIAQNCPSDDGRVRIGLSSADQGFESDDDFRSAQPVIQNGTATHVFEDIPYGTYAVRLYHDANDNNELDTNFMGIPKEAYGFSNNPRSRFGPPSFEQAAFELAADSLTITIEVE